MLAERGYEVVEAVDGEDAISRFEAHDRPIRLVISDVMMRGLDGQRTVERIRAVEPHTKVLYMSGYAHDVRIRSGELEPGTSFIEKPFSGEELATRVRRLLDSSP